MARRATGRSGTIASLTGPLGKADRTRSESHHSPGVLRALVLKARNLSQTLSQRAKLRVRLGKFLGANPTLGAAVYIARGAVVVGDVTLGEHASVWHNAVLRADLNRIVVGHHTNIQDNAVLHLAEEFPCLVGHHVTVGHAAILHACTVGDQVLIGMGAVVLDGAVIGEHFLIGARALVTQGTKIPPGSLVLGAPARVVRALTRAERAQLKTSAEKYAEYAAYCREHVASVGTPQKARSAARRNLPALGRRVPA